MQVCPKCGYVTMDNNDKYCPNCIYKPNMKMSMMLAKD